MLVVKAGTQRRILGLSAGVALILLGALELALNGSDFESTGSSSLCQLGLCASQFSTERRFAIAQKAALGDPRGELEDFCRAVQLSPASAYRWADLGDAELNVQDLSKANYSFSQALKAGPGSPVILMRVANGYFQMGDSVQVVRQLDRVLSDPGLSDYYESAFFTYSRLGLPISDFLKNGLPQRRDVLSSLLTFWAKVHKPDEAVATWKWASSRQLADQVSMGQFFAYLITAGRQDEAQQLWQDYAVKQQPGYRQSNWIFNPGFENPLQASPFDWNIQVRQDIEADRVQDVKLDGEWSFRIRFNGQTNTAYHQTFQDMVLTPGKYSLSAMLKVKQMTTDEGVRLHIFDWPAQLRLNVTTDTLGDTQDWKKISKEFEVPSGVTVVRLEVERQESRMFDNKVSGTTWIDDVRIAKR